MLINLDIAIVFCLLVANTVFCQNSDNYREEFENLDGWEPLTFPKIERHTKYTVHYIENRSVLKAEADASASGIVMKKTFNPFDTPILHWCWRVENILKKGDATRKDGDDYPLRICVLFTYDMDNANFAMRLKYNLAKKLYDNSLPHAGLNYIWANRPHDSRILSNPYTNRPQMLVLRSGKEEVGRWLEEKVNVLEDYRAAFGKEPPKEARIAVMCDTDNTGESVPAFLDYIELISLPEKKGD